MKKKLLLLNESIVIDTIFLFEFLKRLTTPFNQTKAFELGIIDENGRLLKKRSELKTSEEKNAFTMFDLLVRNLKRIIEKFPFGKSKLASYAAALFLIKESKYLDFYANDSDLLKNTFIDFFESINIDTPSKSGIIELMEEPANVVGSGYIAGASPGEQPAVHKKKKKVLRRKCNDDDIERCVDQTEEATGRAVRKQFSEFAKL